MMVSLEIVYDSLSPIWSLELPEGVVNKSSSMCLLAIAIAPLSLTARANPCQGLSMRCFDPCSGTVLLLQKVDTCRTRFDRELGCMKATGRCEADLGNNEACIGFQIRCFDSCQQKSVILADGDTCVSFFDQSAGCSRAYAGCAIQLP